MHDFSLLYTACHYADKRFECWIALLRCFCNKSIIHEGLAFSKNFFSCKIKWEMKFLLECHYVLSLCHSNYKASMTYTSEGIKEGKMLEVFTAYYI
jgi:hypothetical protein